MKNHQLYSVDEETEKGLGYIMEPVQICNWKLTLLHKGGLLSHNIWVFNQIQIIRYVNEKWKTK